jgi:WhiB family redox-sensing transcriptional regulator
MRTQRPGRARLPPGLVGLGAPMPPLAGAACRSADLALFFPQRGQPTTPAKAICAGCPELVVCRTWAVGQPDLVGVWGATSEDERRTLRRRGASMRDAVVVEVDSATDDGALLGADVSTANGNGGADVRRCSVCRKPIEPKRAAVGAKTCAEATCRDEARRRRQRELHRRATAIAAVQAVAPGVTQAFEATPDAVQTFDDADGQPEASRDESRGGCDDLSPIAEPMRASDGPTEDVTHALASRSAAGDLGAIYRALMLIGARVVSVEVVVAGETWTVSRRHGGGPR